MKININIEVSPSELIELQDVAHEGIHDVVTKLSGKDMAHKILEHLEEASNQVACHIPADHTETGTVSLRPNTFPSFEVVNISKEWISRPLRKVELRGDDEWITHNDADPQPTPFRPIPPCMEGKVVRMKGVGVSALTGKEVRCGTMCVVVVDDLRGHALIMSHDDLINVPTSQLQMWDAAPKE